MTEQPGIRAHTIGLPENDGSAAYLQPVSLGGFPESTLRGVTWSNDHIRQDKKSLPADYVRPGLPRRGGLGNADYSLLRPFGHS
jgi:hypothetical protein